MIPAIRSLSYEDWLKSTGLWSLEDRRVRADLVKVFKIIHGMSTVNFNTFFEFSHNIHTRGHSLKLQKKRVHTDLRQHFFTDRVINKWNLLPEETVTANNVNSCKRNLQKMYTDGSFQRLFKSAWPVGPSQIPGESLTGKLFYHLSLNCKMSAMHIMLYLLVNTHVISE